jgi:hypothetical protein
VIVPLFSVHAPVSFILLLGNPFYIVVAEVMNDSGDAYYFYSLMMLNYEIIARRGEF